MQASINGYQLTDETLAGGFALSQTRIAVERIFDIVVPINQLLPVLFDRGIRRTTVDFQISRIHASLEDADKYIADHDAAIPSSGPVQFTATNGAISYLLHAALIKHQLVGTTGKMTTHSYHIEGGRFNDASGFFIETEAADFILLESGDKIETE